MDVLAELIKKARAKKIHAALGHKTFAAYRRDRRRKQVKCLSGQGISNRTIAAVLGVDEGTVRNDLNDGKAIAEDSAQPKKPEAERVIDAFEALVTDEKLWPKLNLDRLQAVHKELGQVIRTLKKQQAIQQAA